MPPANRVLISAFRKLRGGTRTRRAILGGGACAAALATGLFGSAALADPASDFTGDFSPPRGPATYTAVDRCLAPVQCRWFVTTETGALMAEGSGRELTASFDTAGAYDITLSVDDPAEGSGDPVPVTRRVVVSNRPPVARLSAAPASVSVGQLVSFDSRASGDPDGDALTRTWSVDGTVVAGADETLSRTFTAPGMHTVALTVADPSGASDTVTRSFSVVNVRPGLIITATSLDPLTQEPVTFTVASAGDPDGGPLVYAWDLDDDGEYDDAEGERVPDHAFGRPGKRRVGVKVTDDEDEETFGEIVIEVRNRAPLAAFTWSPETIKKRTEVTFTSRSLDPDGGALREEAWDLDGDGSYDDAFGSVVVHTFTRGGTYEVGLRVLDEENSSAVTRMRIVAGNDAPRAAFRVSDERPLVGAMVRLTSASSDPDGDIVGQDWDLDGDGAYDDASGASAQVEARTAGRMIVGLRVTDDDGGTAVALREIGVLEPASAPQVPAAKPKRAARLLEPFPVVRFAGQVTRRGAILRLVQVTAPRGATVRWSCRGRGCRSKRQAVRAGRVRLARLEGTYRAGAVIEIRVTRRNRIGKHTSIKVRAGKAPTRRDRCIYPGRSRPRACPAT